MDDASNPLRDLFSKVFRRNLKEEENEIEEEIINMVNEGHEQGIILKQEAEMINNIFEFGDKEAKDIMTFRQKIIAVDAAMSLGEAVHFMILQNFSRFPVYEEDIDNIIGVLHLKDAMKFYLSDQDNNTPIKAIATDAFYVHDTQQIGVLFKEMQSKKIHMAIVLDEYGQTEGIVAMEDILEVIFGNILDEYDVEESDVIKLTEPDSYLIQGLTRLDEVSELLTIDFPEEDIETLNGFLVYQLGHLPKEDEEIEIIYEGYSFKPVDIHDKMIKQAMVKKIITK